MSVDFMGSAIIAWTGIVENRIDPLEQDRIQVRIHGIHSQGLSPDDKTGQGIDLESLPWARLVNSTDDASMNGIGTSGNNLVEGSMVFGISMDGRTFQQLFILGTLKGMPKSSPNRQEGFCDHKDTLPLAKRPKRPLGANEQFPLSDHLNESDVHRLARGITKGTIVEEKINAIIKGVVNAIGDTWDEPKTPFNPTYPFNHVTESESGHITEVDDTPDNERTHKYHRTGTFEEVHPDGTKVTKVVKDNYEIISYDNHILVKGTCNINVVGNANIHVEKTTTLKTKNAIIDSGHIELGKNASEKVVLGNTFMKLFNKLTQMIRAHTHKGNMGVPTSAPLEDVPDMTDKELSQDNTYTL